MRRRSHFQASESETSWTHDKRLKGSNPAITFDSTQLPNALERAIAACPSSAMAWTMASATSGFLGDGPTAVRQAEQGVRLSPLDARSFWHEGLLGQAHYVNGDYEQALEWVRSAVARNDLIRFNHRLLIATLGALGRSEDAKQAARHYLQIEPGFRISSYAKRCPFRGALLETWLGHLRSAGLPD